MTPTLITITAAIAAPLGAYLIAAKRFSGRIESSDAKDLWEESRAIREWSSNRIDQLSDRIEALERENQELKASLRKAQERIDELEAG